ncbi:MAG: succinate dehydrogenase flavoprotein subunit [Phycisphaerae bacterium]|nr:succinate dehydrogenase flavoprotein subunit [Phycisphaerae bacterium]MBM91864.1 succinate dehydrogenase flavoprotein subunit [Phycisphaerae bacterium]
MADEKRVIVVGGGLAGLAASVRIAEAGVPVDLFSMVPVKRSHSVCAQGGINACNEVARQQGYSEYQHFDETLIGGDFLNDQHPVLEMANWAPKIIDLLDRMGVPFNRSSEGFRDLRLFGGSLFKRTHFAGATTGQQLLYALDEQTRRFASEGKVNMMEFWEFLYPITEGEGEDKRCVGIVAQDMRTMQIRSFRADAVVMATGGCGLVFGKSTNSIICTGGAASRCYQAGAWYGNPEMIQVHPTAIPGADKCRLMSESARGEGGRVWVPRKKGDTRKPTDIPENERYYILEERYPKYGNLVPRDIATREIFDVCVNEGMGINGGNQVYLDLTHKDPEYLTRKLGGILDIYEKFVGDDPRYTPMRIFPAVHYSMGGLWTTYTPGDYQPEQPGTEHKPGNPIPIDAQPGHGLTIGAHNNAMTNITGLYAFGEVNFAYHGATRLGANALLSCIFDGLCNGVSVVNYVREGVDTPASELDQSIFDQAQQAEQAKHDKLMASVNTGKGDQSLNPYQIGQEMGEVMNAASTVVKTGPGLEKCLAKLDELRERFSRVELGDGAMWTNQSLSYARSVGDMLILAEAIAKAGLLREESRGSHYRTDFPERDDERFWKTSVAKFNEETGKSDIEFIEVKAGLVKLRPRNYGKVDSGTNKEKIPPKQVAQANA